MAEIEQLSIGIEAEAPKAAKTIDSLVEKLDILVKHLSAVTTTPVKINIDTSKFDKIGKSLKLDGLDKAAKVIGASTAQITDRIEEFRKKYENIGKSFEASDSLKKAQSQLLRFNDLFQKAKLDKESFEASGDLNAKGYELAVENFYKYGNVIENIKQKITELNHTPIKFDFSQMSEAELDKALGFPNIHTWNNQVSEASETLLQETKETAREFTGIWSGIALPDLGSSIKEFGNKLSQLEIPPIKEENLDKLSASLEKAERSLDELRANLANGITMGRITESVDDKGYVKLQEQIALTEKTAAALRDRIEEVGKEAKNASGIKEAGKAANFASDSFSDLAKSGTKASNSLKKMQDSLKGVLKAMLPILGIRELFRFGKESIKSSMDYLEVLNYFDAAFGQVAANADLSSFEEMGYSSAEAYYSSFAQRAEELTQKMSGFTIGEGGLLESTGTVSLGLDPSQLMNYQAMFGQMSSSMGVSSETSMKLSQALTEIGADLASIKNLEFETVWNDMASGLAGMSRTLDKYGVNIRNVNLQQKLMELGIDANIQSLNQNDKTLLRAIILLENTKYAWGDLADTINQPANQLRMIEANFQNLSRTIGNLFLPLVKTVLPYVNALVIAVQRLFAWLGNLMGIDISGISTSIGGADMGDILDQTDDLASGLGGAKEEADKLNKSLRQFDELKVISTKQDNGGGAGGGAGLQGGLLDEAFNKAFSDYQKVWDEAFGNLENRAQEIADKIEKAFEPLKKIIQDFAIGDFFQAGKDVSNLVKSITSFFTKAIKKVNWKKIGKNIGDFLAGIDWIGILKGVGELIWAALKAALDVWAGAFDAAPIETGILTAVSVLKFTKLGNVLTGKINTALSKVKDGLSLQGIATAIAGVFAEFTLVSDAFEGIISGSQGVGSALMEIVTGAGLAVGALKLIGLSNPWTAVIVGISGVVGAFKGMHDAQQEALQKLAEERELSVFGDHLSNITTRLNEAAQATKDMMSASIDYVQNAGIGEMKLAEDLANRYFELKEKQNLSNQETEEMQRLSEILIQKFPELEQYYNDQTGLIDTTRKTVDELIESKLKEIQLNAVSEKLTEIYQKREEVLRNLEEAAEDASNAQDEMKRLQSEYNELAKMDNALRAYTEIGELRGKGITQLDDSTRSQSLLNQAIEAGVEPTEDLAELQERLKEVLTANGEELPKTLYEGTFKFSEQMSTLESEIAIFSEQYKGAWNTYEAQKEALEKTESTISRLEQMLSSGFEGTGTEFADTYKDEVLRKVEEVDATAKEMGTSSAKSAVDGYANELNSQSTKNTVAEAAYSLVDAAMNAWAKAQDSNSPSKVTMGFGKDAVDGYNLGITQNASSSKTAVSSWMSNITGVFSEWISKTKENFGIWGKDTLQGFTVWSSDTVQKFSEWGTYSKEKISNFSQESKRSIDIWRTETSSKIESWKNINFGKINAWSENTKGTIGNWKANTQNTFENWKNDTSGSVGRWSADIEGKFTQWKTNTENTTSSWYGNMQSYFTESKWNFGGVSQGLGKAFSSAFESVKGIWNSFAGSLNQKLTWTIDPIVTAGKKIFEGTTINLGNIPKFAKGGITLSHTFAEIGEYNRPEAILPLTNDRAMGMIAESIYENYNGGAAESGFSPDSIKRAVYTATYNAVSAAMNNSSLLREQNEILEGILEKPTIGRDDIGRNAVSYIQGEERRLQKSLVGTY